MSDSPAGAGDDADHAALHAAIAAGDLARVEHLLGAGASPLARGWARDSPLRAAHRLGDAAIVQRVRRAAREAGERGTDARGLVGSIDARRYSLRRDRGVGDLRRAMGEARRLDVLLARCELKVVARALATLVSAPRREADVASRPVQDAARLVFVYRLKGIDWTIVPFVFEPASPWNVEDVPELAAPGSGVGPIARALAAATSSRVVHVKHDEHTLYDEHGGIETRPSDEDEVAALSALVPPMRVRTDGYHVRLELDGLEPSDVERVDLVVLQELGDPLVDRRVALPTQAPAIVGAPVLLAPGLPPMVEQAPARSEPPPLVREPPPIVMLDEPAPSDAAPLARQPPPLVPGAVKSDGAPSAAEPPPAAGAKSAPPPLVHAPPPLVAPPSEAGEAAEEEALKV